MIYKFIYWLMLASLGALAWGVIIGFIYTVLCGMAEFIGLI